MIARFESCGKCSRKMLVERHLIGVNHTAAMAVTCWECLDENAQKAALTLYKLDE